MTGKNEDLYKISVDAHIRFMYPKFNSEEEKIGFRNCCENNKIMARDLDNKLYAKGYFAAVAMRREVRQKIRERFDESWTKDYVDGLEKL